MSKVKVFIHDDQMLGLPGCHRFLQGQTYCFALDTGPGFGLFLNKKRTNPVALLKDDAWKGCIGELWEVSPEVQSALNNWYWMRDAHPVGLFVPATGHVTAWATSPAKIRGAKMRAIRDYRDTLYTGGRASYQPSTPPGGPIA